MKADPAAWKNFQRFPASYKRIRVGWIDASRSGRRSSRPGSSTSSG
jgi:hypothetical protein